MPIISRELFLKTKIDDPKNRRVSSSPSDPGWRKLRPGAGSADLTLFCPDLALLFPGPHSRQEGNSQHRLPFIPTRTFPSTSVSYPSPPCSTFAIPARRRLPHPRILPRATRTHARRRAFSRVSFNPLPSCPGQVRKFTKPTSSHQRERSSNRLRYWDLEWNRGSVTVTIYNDRVSESRSSSCESPFSRYARCNVSSDRRRRRIRVTTVEIVEKRTIFARSVFQYFFA